jgi:UPF0271 protein
MQAGEKAGIRVAGEVWVDRTYDATGSLLPSSHSRAIIKNPQEILNQASQLIRYGEVIAVDGTRVRMEFDTIHLHAQVAQAKYVAEQIRLMLPRACSLIAEPFLVGQQEDNDLAYSGG